MKIALWEVCGKSKDTRIWEKWQQLILSLNNDNIMLAYVSLI